jgi:iron complex transport system ATP-binding protein
VTEPLLDYRDVTVHRGDRIALDRLSLQLAPGGHLAIVGPNGSGKSTLIKTFTRECYPVPNRDGSSPIHIMGRDTWDVTTLRSMLGIVTNDLVEMCTRGMSTDQSELPRRVTGRQTVLSGFFSSIGIWAHHEVTPAMGRKADETIERLEIAHIADRPLDELSSGEARRFVIGRALVHEPQALVLDEPTNSLDLRASHELREAVRRIARAGLSIVLVTHHLPDIIPEIDRVILLDRGRIVQDGPKADVLTSAALSAMFRLDLEVIQRDGYFHVL